MSPALPDASLSDTELAIALAEGAGKVLLTLRDGALAHDAEEFDGKAFKDAGDAASQEWLASALSHARPGDAVLSEEAKDSAARLTADRVWIIDPLDGTREFSERNDAGIWRDDFAVHIALWESGAGLTVGAVGLPARGEVKATPAPACATARNDAEAPLKLAASRTRPPAFVADLAEQGEVDLVPMGSAGVKVMAVLDGTVDAYVHGGGQYEWDSAAPVAVAQAAGLHCTRLDGSPLEYNREDPWLPDLIVCHPTDVARVSAMLASVGANQKPMKEGDR
ncbi:3'(2'),5'-bisphosphate nucleotidase CysQ [Brevibacterium samyangense]|uniref:3'(2'),5-bisphosphonucleoside 3'(2')-phosphohydrolase n=1 Tax=Brevibacterium samyangense TaxID=366888 RepID=A0ABP5F151_9MICO